MDSIEKEQFFDAITMSLRLGDRKTARHVFDDVLRLMREEVIEECIDLALKRDSFFLVGDLERMKIDK